MLEAPWNVGILIFEQVEVLDFAGPFEVFSRTRIDLLVVPGGFGTRPLLQDEETLDWIRAVARDARQVTSVCTGSMLLARAGLLRGKRLMSRPCSSRPALGPFLAPHER